jgi:Domain of unknown function (DUF4919)
LVAAAERGDRPIDYTALRFSYAQSPTYDPGDHTIANYFHAAWQASLAKDCKTVMEQSEAFLKVDFLSITMHTVRGICLKEAGDKPGYNREMSTAYGITRSLLDDGDGNSSATAYTAINPAEEAYVLAGLGLNEVSQALVRENGHVYDVLSTRDPKTGAQRNVYFNIDDMFAAESRFVLRALIK